MRYIGDGHVRLARNPLMLALSVDSLRCRSVLFTIAALTVCQVGSSVFGVLAVNLFTKWRFPCLQLWTEEECRSWIEANVEVMAARGFCQWAVETAVPDEENGLACGELLGFCGFRSWDNPQPGVQGALLGPLCPAMGWCDVLLALKILMTLTN